MIKPLSIIVLLLTLLTITPKLAAKSFESVDLPDATESSEKPTVEVKSTTEINDAAKLLVKILQQTITYRAEFKQSVYRENSDIPEITLGTFLIQRPNHFRWQTTQPFEQTIVADGESLWTYDPELEQATLQNQHAVLADSPLLLLTSSVDSLIEAFTISEIISRDEEKDNDNPDSLVKPDVTQENHLFSLVPKKNSLFETVHILIKDKKIKEFFLTDTLGGRTSVEFNNIMLNQRIDIYEFIFVPPEDIDIIDSREFISD